MSSQTIHEQFSTDQFIDLIMNGDDGARTKLVHEYTPQLYRASFGLGFKNDDADELIQKTWLTFFETIHRFERRSHLRTYIFGILYLKAKEQKRINFKQFKMETIDTLVEEKFDERGEWLTRPLEPSKFMEVTQSLENVKLCIDDIPINYRMAFILREIEEQDSKEICKILDITDTNLGVLLFRAKNKLKACLEKKYQVKD